MAFEPLEKQTTVCFINDFALPVNLPDAGVLMSDEYHVAQDSNRWFSIVVSMSRPILISILALSLLGCATASAPPDAGDAIARLSPEDLARLLPKPDPKLPLAEVVRMSKEGATAQDIIARIRETGSRYDLAASQAIELHAEGVSAEVLDYIQSAREQQLRDRMAEEINQREQRHAEELRRERELRRNSYFYDPWWPAPPGYRWYYDYRFRPYGGFYWRR